MKIFVTGGAGFIGIHLCRKLALHHEVTVFDNFSNSKQEHFPVIPNLTLIVGDILDSSKLHNSMKNHDIVIHLAAKTDVIDSISNSDDTFKTNVKGTQNIVNSCESHSISKIIVTSSAAVYQNSTNYVDETSDTKPSSPYGQSKLDMEKIIKESKVNHIILRLFNVYGNGQTKGVIAKFIENLSKNEPLIIFGDGSAIRDFIHIDDVVNAILLSIKSKSGVYNIASGTTTSINNLAKLLKELFNKKSKIIFKPIRPGEIIFSAANVDKSQKELKFHPKISLNDGLKLI